MSNLISIDTRKVSVKERHFYVSVITINEEIRDYQSLVDSQLGSAYDALARELSEIPDQEQQKSACVVINLEPILETITPEIIENWAEQTKKENVRTQRALFDLFKRPVFSIMTLPHVDQKYLIDREQTLNAAATSTHVVANYEEAMSLAGKLLAIAHGK